jgi:polar amino acid transport system permease protein
MQFNVILQYHDELLHGLWLTIQISVASILLGTALGILAATARQMGGRLVRLLVDTYVEVFRNTPFLVQLFIIFFGLPALGLRIGATSAALIAMTINLGAYATEIVRAGMQSIHRTQIEAGEALGLTRLQVYRHVVLVPALAKVWPALCSQFVLMMLASSVTSAISTPELAAAAALIESQTFRSFEAYILVTLVYLALALMLRGLLAFLGKWLFGRRAPRAASLMKIKALPAGGAL